MQLFEFLIKGLRECYTKVSGFPSDRAIDSSRVDYFDESANDYIYNRISEAYNNKEGLAICKFGSIEVANIVSKIMSGQWKLNDYFNLIKGYPVPIFRYKEIERLHMNAGFFPATENSVEKFISLMINEIPKVDILASYVYCERYISEMIDDCVKVNLDGFYAPFKFEKPWSRILENKKVLVIHPFIDSISAQYQKRQLLFDNQDVLPEFKSLHLIKAVQSIAGNECGFESWFDALDSMKREIDKVDFDIALIGCGAYGFPLTTYVKSLGKIGIHLAGWTQMLFGIYGKRWVEHQSEYSKFINSHWIRPSKEEVPNQANLVEGGCYW